MNSLPHNRQGVAFDAGNVTPACRRSRPQSCNANGTRGPRSHGLGTDGLRTALEAYRHPELPEGLDGCWNVAPGVLDCQSAFKFGSVAVLVQLRLFCAD